MRFQLFGHTPALASLQGRQTYNLERFLSAGLQGQLVEREHGAAGEAEILAARLAAVAQRAGRAAGLIDDGAAAMGAVGLAVRGGPADAGEHGFRVAVGRAQHLGQ